jgi:nucleoside recognition membrane protein YjiH
MVGGFVIVFSVIFKILSLFNIISLMSSILYIPLSLFGVTKELCYAFISGLFEMTIGCNKIAGVASAPQVLKTVLASFLIGFSGLSILAQCCNFLAKTDINVGLYIFSKFLHGVLSGLFTFLLYPLSKSTALVSNFSSLYDVLYNNIIWNYYISNYKILLPIFIIIYILLSLIIIEKTSYKRKKES